MKLAQCYVRLLKKVYSPNGYSIMQNGGQFNDTGQFHLHVFQRNNKEEFSWTYSDEVDKEAFAYEKLKQTLEPQFKRLLESPRPRK